MPIGMLVVLDSILNRITQNRAKGKQTFIFIDEIYLLFQHEYSANFLFTLWKRVRKYGAYATGITQNVDDLLQSHTARNEVDNRYLFQYLKAPFLMDYVDKKATGGTIKHLNQNILVDFPVVLPHKAEQEKIGEYFLAIDHLITLHQREFAFLCKEKSKKFRYIKNAWEQRKLGDVVDVRSGKDYKHLSEGNIPVYGTGGFMLSVNQALSYDEDAIGIGRKGTIDKPYILKAPFWTVDTLFYAIPREKVDLNFAFDVFQNIDWKKKDESTGVPSLSKTAINEIDVLVPQYDEQQPLGQFFNRIDNLITLHQRKPNFYTGGYYAE